MTEARGACVVLFDTDDRVLLIREDYGGRRWGLPGGLIEDGESPAEAARREALEETGLEVVIGAQIGHYEVDYGDHLHHIFGFHGSVVGGVLGPNEGEIAEARWVDPAAMPDPMRNDRLAVDDAVAGRSGVRRRVAPNRMHVDHR